MATYKGISGFNIKSLSSDPSNLLEGEIWYNSTSGTLKVAPLVSSWASGTALSVKRYGSVAAGTTQNTALVAAGTDAPSYTSKNETEEYDGSSWTAGGVYPTAGAGQRGCGTQTAALGIAPSGVTNYYNGSTWTAQPSPAHNLPVAKHGAGMCGTQTSGLLAGGTEPGGKTTATEEYDGSGWTASPGTLTNAVSGLQMFGIQTAAIRVGGDLGPANTTNVDSYNGTTWTATTVCPLGIKDGYACGTQAAGLLASGAGPSPADAVSTVCLSWDGSAWATTASMATSRRDNTGGSNSSPGFSTTNAGGNNPPTVSITTTEEYNNVTTAETVTTS